MTLFALFSCSKFNIPIVAWVWVLCLFKILMFAIHFFAGTSSRVKIQFLAIGKRGSLLTWIFHVLWVATRRPSTTIALSLDWAACRVSPLNRWFFQRENPDHSLTWWTEPTAKQTLSTAPPATSTRSRPTHFAPSSQRQTVFSTITIKWQVWSHLQSTPL